ncbi:putative pentatricopeptide repeat-containing protein [Drosera capensis]
MFWKCGMGDDADKLFKRVQERDLVSWNTMISGLDQSMRYAESLELFRSMVIDFVNGLLEMYMKHGNNKYAEFVFDRSLEDPSGNTVLWNVMLLGYATNGCFLQALLLLDDLMSSGMKAVGVKLDKVAFTCVKFARSHTGRLDDGSKYFRTMVKEYGIEPELEQCNFIVDLLGRAGYLKNLYVHEQSQLWVRHFGPKPKSGALDHSVKLSLF